MDVAVSVTVTVDVVAVERKQPHALLMRASLEEHLEMIACSGASGRVVGAGSPSPSTMVGARFWKMVVALPVVTVTVPVVTVTVVKAVSRPTAVVVTVSISVTVVVAGARDNHEEQKASPTAGSSAIAPKHLLEPHGVQAALAKPTKMLAAPKQSALQDFILILLCSNM